MTTVVDLSHDYYEGMPHAGTIPAPGFREVLHIEEAGLRCMELTIPTHVGTHIDAPSHFVADGDTIEHVPPETLVGPAFCVEVRKPPDTPITVADLPERCHHPREDDALLIRTGWDTKYGGSDYAEHHPYLSDDCAQWIVDRGYRLIGIDTVTPELPVHLRPEKYPAPVHTTLLGNGVLIVENLALADVVNQSFILVVGALRILGGDGSPARVFALVE